LRPAVYRRKTRHIILAEEEISDVSLATFFVFDKETAGARSVLVSLPGTEAAADEAAADEPRGCGGGCLWIAGVRVC
jgi:hypothetical protein